MGLSRSVSSLLVRTLLPAALTLTGCSSLGVPSMESLTESATTRPATTRPPETPLAQPSSDVLLVADPPARPDVPREPERKKAAAPGEEEPYDPFATPGAGAEGEYDPWEPWNSVMFEFNRKIDRYILKPVAKVWDKVMPDKVERGISRSFTNLHFVPRFLNNVLQGKVKGAGIELSRFVLNSTFGLAGFIDFAGEVFDLRTPLEDTGQTLGAWGVPPGPYLILPFLPQPFTVRDAFGYVGDIMMNPVYYFLFSTIRVGQPAAVTHQSTAGFATMGLTAGQLVNERSINLEKFQGVEEATVDLYSAVRNAYLQRRARDIRE